jgi:branched-chain amino acid transport system ATP-binding protein
MLEIAGLATRYGRIEALRGIDLAVGAGELVALVGANGAGKSTLLHTIAGLQPASAGRIAFAGADITRLPAEARVRAGIVQVPEGRQVFSSLAVEDNLRLGAFTRRRAEAEESLAAVYERFPVLRERRHSPAGALSGGQQQMLAIGRALMARPRLLLLDEPSMGLAPLLVDEIFEAVLSLRADGTTVLLVEQNASAALSIADRGYVLETGRIILAGEGRALLRDARVKSAYLGA